jgi:hypothetical protein
MQGGQMFRFLWAISPSLQRDFRMLDDDPTRVNCEPVSFSRFASCFEWYWEAVRVDSAIFWDA